MSIASQVTSLVQAIANAINARPSVGASDYQMWLAQGNVGTLDDYRAAQLGADTDFTATFNSQLGSIPTGSIASTTVAGITQLATPAETQTGTSALKAVTPASLASTIATSSQLGLTRLATTAEAQAGAEATKAITAATLLATQAQYRVTTLAALNTIAASAPQGTIIYLGQFTTTNGIHYRSLWTIDGSNKGWLVSPLETSNAAALSDITGQFGSLTNLAIPQWGSEGIVRSTKFYSRFVWTSSAWMTRNPQPILTQNDGGANTVQAFGSGFTKFAAYGNTHADWDDTNKVWTCPSDGTYWLTASVRWADNTPANNNIGVGVQYASSTGPYSFFGWATPGSAGVPRFQTSYGRMWLTTKGTQFAAFAYCNGAANANAIEFSAFRIGD